MILAIISASSIVYLNLYFVSFNITRQKRFQTSTFSYFRTESHPQTCPSEIAQEIISIAHSCLPC